MSFLEVDNISKSFEGHQALSEVSLKIENNSIFGLLGHNGAGKTTLIRIMTRILLPDMGRMMFEGESLTAEHVRHIGYLPEERGLYKKMKVGEQLLYLARLKEMSNTEAKQSVSKWLKRFDLSDKKNVEIGTLSKGMQQKVQFIAAVINNPKFIILDEPFSGFDPINVELIKSEILELKKQGATILYSTHRMDSADELCDDLAILNRSRKVLDGNIEVLKNELNENKYELIYTGRLVDEIREKIVSIDEKKQEKKAILKVNESPNEFLSKALRSKIEIVSFKQMKPTVEDLFFKYVK